MAKKKPKSDYELTIEQFNLDETAIHNLLGKKYQKALSNIKKDVRHFIYLWIKLKNEGDNTSNEDMANFIKEKLDTFSWTVTKIYTKDEFDACYSFIEAVKKITEKLENKQETYLSEYPEIGDLAKEVFERIFYQDFWDKEDKTKAIVFSSAINFFSTCKKYIHCYTQKNGNVLITTNKYEWLGDRYSNEPRGGCLGILLGVALILILLSV